MALRMEKNNTSGFLLVSLSSSYKPVLCSNSQLTRSKERFTKNYFHKNFFRSFERKSYKYSILFKKIKLSLFALLPALKEAVAYTNTYEY